MPWATTATQSAVVPGPVSEFHHKILLFIDASAPHLAKHFAQLDRVGPSGHIWTHQTLSYKNSPNYKTKMKQNEAKCQANSENSPNAKAPIGITAHLGPIAAARQAVGFGLIEGQRSSRFDAIVLWPWPWSENRIAETCPNYIC